MVKEGWADRPEHENQPCSSVTYLHALSCPISNMTSDDLWKKK